MGQKKSGNAVCMICGKWADVSCSYCKRHLCEKHARVWPHPKPDGTPTTRSIITCGNRKCQAKLPSSARKALAAAFKNEVGPASEKTNGKDNSIISPLS
jgi:hypothetical protein